MVENREFVRFLSWTSAFIVGVAAIVMALVFVVDPYRIYRLIDQPGFNHIKPAVGRYQEEIKITGARAIKTNAFILGNSRAEIGFNPEYAGFAQAGLSPYNLAISGTRISTAKRASAYLRETGQTPALMVLGLEFIDFLQNAAESKTAITDTTAALYNTSVKLKNAYPVDQWKWKFETLFSLASVSDTLDTLLIQRQPEVETITPRGFNPLLEYKKYAREQGYYALFQQRAMENAKNFARKSTHQMYAINGAYPDLQDLQKVLSSNSSEHSGNTEIHLIIYPYHAQILMMFEQLGLWPLFEEWKTLIAKEVAFVQATHPNASITLWDFSGFSPIQCEKIPSKDHITAATQWYWEAGHFKSTLGDVMLSKILTKQKAAISDSSFGFLLTSGNIKADQLRIQNERATCMATYPELFADVAKLIKGTQP
ncbi:hypothetical protein BH11PSE12_BH11PSE12_21800 [soil metagenome]